MQIVPQSENVRSNIKSIVQRLKKKFFNYGLITTDDLLDAAKRIVKESGIETIYTDYTGLLLGNQIFYDEVFSTGYKKRVIVIPQCLRAKTDCIAEIDEDVFYCMECGKCPIHLLQHEAEKMGSYVVVAEGTKEAMQLLKNENIVAIIGVGCLPSLKKLFGQLLDSGVPGIAIPLLNDGCLDTTIDSSEFIKIIKKLVNTPSRFFIDIKDVRDSVKSWFKRDTLNKYISINGSETENVGVSWISDSGKRWRPFLLTSIYATLTKSKVVPENVKKLAIAIECFHKASLIHDDIQDGDTFRNGKPALHCKTTVPFALNVGDFLIGEGYRLINSSDISDGRKIKILAETTQTHRQLCIGQGQDILFSNQVEEPSLKRALDDAYNKTSPAFSLPILIAGIAADESLDVLTALKDYARELGVAYQIKDDIDDFIKWSESRTAGLSCPIVLSFLYENTNEDTKIISQIIRENKVSDGDRLFLSEKFKSPPVYERLSSFYHDMRKKVFLSIDKIDNPDLQALLFKLTLRFIKKWPEK